MRAVSGLHFLRQKNGSPGTRGYGGQLVGSWGQEVGGLCKGMMAEEPPCRGAGLRDPGGRGAGLRSHMSSLWIPLSYFGASSFTPLPHL